MDRIVNDVRAVMSLGKALLTLIVFIWLSPKVSGGVPKWGNKPYWAI